MNNKGMTLIETIIALVIVSTASLIMLTGFVTTFNVITESNTYKDVTNKEQTALINEAGKDSSIHVDSKDATYSITVNEGSESIKVTGAYKKASSKTYDSATLYSFEANEVATNDTNAGKNIYDNYETMMKSLYDYLKDNNVDTSLAMNSGTVKKLISSWLKEQTGQDVSSSDCDIITNTAKFYNYFYSDFQIDTLASDIVSYNSKFDSSKYKYVTPCLYLDKTTSVADFFENNNYKNYLFITIGSSATDRPGSIYALYNNNSTSDDVDEWLVPESSVSSSTLSSYTFNEFYNSIKNNSSWHTVTTRKSTK